MRNELSEKTADTTKKVEPLDQSVNAFCRDLTAISRLYRIGLSGSPELFVYEVDDLDTVYTCDKDSRLNLN